MNTVDDIFQRINLCNKCSLHKNKLVRYSYRGNEKASIMLIGEALGKKEQEEGFPFVGRSGKLLDKMLAVLGLTENDVFITNVVCCRPPENRKPFYDEIVVCSTFLCEQIELIKPRLIITLGKTAGDWFSNYKEYKINTYYKERRWLPVYHPSYLLRKRSEIKNFIVAFKEALEELK
jgi:DNA polymerase